MSFFIEISSPNKKNVRLMLTESHLVIGRSGVCDFVIDDPYVSGTHIELWVEN
jgi:pSer/pThr/pTyr-binding forkhead associated (FHA) protein